MKIESFIKNCQQQGIHLYVKNGELNYRAKKGAMTKEILAELKDRKADILSYLNSAKKEESRFQLTSTSIDRALLFNKFLWKDYSNRIMDVSTANAAHIVIRHTGKIHTDSLVKSIEILLERHKVLSSSIEISDGNLYLKYRQKQAPAFQEIVIKEKTDQQCEEKAMQIANDLVWDEYDLENGPLYRVFFLKISETDYILGCGLHHAVGDGISIEIFFQEISAIYSSIMMNVNIQLPQVRYQFMDYLVSMEEWSRSQRALKKIDYWKDTLKLIPFTGLLLNENISRDKTSEGSSAEVLISFNSDVASDLKVIASRLKKTLFCILLAVHKITIWKMTDQEELIIIALNTGRINPGFKNMIGNIAMEIAYKTNLAGNPSFMEITERITISMNEAQYHQPVPLDWIRRELSNEGISFNAPAMSLLPDSTGENESSSAPRRLKFSPPDVPHGCHGFPVSYAIEFNDSSSGIKGSLVYRTDLYKKSTVKAFIECFQETVYSVIKDPEKKLQDF